MPNPMISKTSLVSCETVNIYVSMRPPTPQHKCQWPQHPDTEYYSCTCNAPVTFQCLMMVIFHDHLGHFIYVYLDDLFVYSETIKEHEQHLRAVFEILRKDRFYLKKEKCNLYTVRLNCLGHIIDEKGVHADRDKMSWIRSWRTPKNLNEV